MEILASVLWYVVISAAGWMAFPLAFRLLPGLPDRGYAFTRALGLLLWSYVFWLLASFGVLRNSLGGLLFALVVLASISLWALHSSGWHSLRTWLQDQWRVVLSVELVALLAYAAWIIVRAANPEIAGTEKPMELAFINAILRSDSFPPLDPWLSGYSISYYYFGYVMVAMLAKFIGVAGSVAFNLAVASTFALSAAGAYGLVFNLLALRYPQRGNRMTIPALLGPIFVLMVSNLEGFLHALHARGLFWLTDAAGQLYSPFWSWLDLKELKLPPSAPASWIPSQFWWWWSASRVIQDYDLAGIPREIIDEFPFFSYLLADLHPHVLAMPFAFLAVALALNVFVGGSSAESAPWWWPSKWLSIHPTGFTLAAVTLGGMAFLNTWDLPVYVMLFAAAYTCQQFLAIRSEGMDSDCAARFWLWDFLIAACAIGAAGILFYLPFYLGFSSQAGGPLPNLIYPTRGAHLWVMFAALLIPIFTYMGYLTRRYYQPRILLKGLRIAAVVCLGLWLLSLLFGVLISLLPIYGDLFLSTVAATDMGSLLREAVLRRALSPGGWVTLLLLLALGISLLLRFLPGSTKPVTDQDSQPNYDEIIISPQIKTDTFSLLLILLGALLVLGIEFFFLRDQFGWRMNTIFKFYFQTWHLWAVAAAFATCVLLWELRRLAALIFGFVIAGVLILSLVYPLLSLSSKTNGFQPASGWTLDGAAYLELQSPDEMAAARWLAAAPFGVLAEAVSPSGGSYTNYARMSMLSGLPAVLGWSGHESQWRGGGQEIGTRQLDLERLYCTRDAAESRSILESYHIRYIIVAGLERTTYAPGNPGCPGGLNEAKFLAQFNPVFQQGSVTIYEFLPTEAAKP